ncbi:MAG: hypothetical protein A3D92_10800 [Bacteroidetes bacterium RIFCSPHIGHO2_02_FULL_44_7]|nr:MAG: hypothetical protein A3D92_10800 [Bacteroidetes bacterium RIFCSPHIGHO2_02_FULL_44_7]
MVVASATGLFRTILILIGGFVLLRFLGQLMRAKRNMEEERSLLARQRKFEEEKRKTAQNSGKTKIIRDAGSAPVEDVDFEELD